SSQAATTWYGIRDDKIPLAIKEAKKFQADLAEVGHCPWHELPSTTRKMLKYSLTEHLLVEIWCCQLFNQSDTNRNENRSKLDCRKYDFSNIVVNAWNALPDAVFASSNSHSFNLRLSTVDLIPFLRAMGLLPLLLLSSLMLQNGQAFSSSQGKQFITAFMENFETNRPSETSLKLFLVGHGNDTRVSVTVTRSSSRQSYSVASDETVPVDLPVSLEMKGSGIFPHSIVIEAEHDISVVSFNRKLYSVGSMTLYPVHELGNSYYVITPPGNKADSYKKEFAVVAWQTPTQVTVELQGGVYFKGRSYAAGTTLTVRLKAFEVLQLQSTEDLSGTRVQSSAPVAVLSGHVCVQENYYCDHVAEQLLPDSKWGKTFIVPPVPLQTGFDIIYVAASQSTRVVYQSGQEKGFQDMVPGKIAQFQLQSPQALYISADAGIQVLMFFTGIKIRNIGYDPFLINIPDVNSYGLAYRIHGLRKFDNHVLVVAKSSETLTWDGSVEAGIQWQSIPGSEYFWGEYNLQADLNQLSVFLENPQTPFGVLAYGNKNYEGYGFAPSPFGTLAPVPDLDPVQLTCPENSHYLSCGNACPATCSDREAPSRCQNTCAEVCQCDQGYLFSGEKCVPMESCNCTYNGVSYRAGEEFWADENCRSHCRCDNRLGKTVCVKSSCKAKTKCIVVNGVRGCHATTYSTCIASGDPHYRTFDGTKYDFMGSCVYKMVGVSSKNPALTPFSVTVENDNRGHKAVSFTKSVTLEVYNLTISLSKSAPHRAEVQWLNIGEVEDEVYNLPFSGGDGKFWITQEGNNIIFQSPEGFKVIYDTANYVEVSVPRSYQEQTSGLGGNFNENLDDDFMLADGTPTPSVDDFGISWEVPTTGSVCSKKCVHELPAFDQAQTIPYKGDRFCGLLTLETGPFKDCHSFVSPEMFFHNCLYDMQVFGEGALCQNLQAYTAKCQAAGAEIDDWRTAVSCRSPVSRRTHLFSVLNPEEPITPIQRDLKNKGKNTLDFHRYSSPKKHHASGELDDTLHCIFWSRGSQTCGL
ncbi:PREDICTED: IgGFc-binding protein-like, partial [Thamnophis sirtalis]|uniref:IgGFc-binding protein-like n=1 Tax=Thamnophis sirtalis TaxID=35019 RepID=A0A6I9Z1F3_9SAUR